MSSQIFVCSLLSADNFKIIF